MSVATQNRGHGRVIARLLLGAALMFGFGFAMVPLYSVVCQLTGLNGRVSTSAAEPAPDQATAEARVVSVEFVANLRAGMPWEFRPAVVKMQVQPGKSYQTSFTAHNLNSTGKVAQAVPSVAPGRAARHLLKTECFCFTRQEFQPGEQREMPLVFMVDRDLPKDVSTLTLSYTFYELDEPLAQQQSGNRDQASIGGGA